MKKSFWALMTQLTPILMCYILFLMKVNVLKYGVVKKYKRCKIKDNKYTFIAFEESNFTFQFFELKKDN